MTINTASSNVRLNGKYHMDISEGRGTYQYSTGNGNYYSSETALSLIQERMRQGRRLKAWNMFIDSL